MEEFTGIVSLFLACLELVLFFNLIVFAEKNVLNKLVILIIGLLALYQLTEFVICYFSIYSSVIIYLTFVFIIMFAALGLHLSIKLYGYNKRTINIVYLPALILIFYYPTVLEEFSVSECTLFYSAYNYPLAEIFGLLYFVPIYLTMILLFLTIRKMEGVNKKFVIILLIGYIIAFVPASFFVLALPDLWAMKLSIFSKFSLFLALSYTYFGIMYKENKQFKENSK